MSVLSVTEGDLFTIRVFKQHTSNPDRVWANNYEFRAKAAGDEGDVATLLGQMVEFEAAIHYAYIRIIRASASTWEPDSVPYDPAAFVSIPMATLGARTGDAQGIGLKDCMRVNRIPASGRFGNLFYRGCLEEDEIDAPAGTTIISTASGAFTIFSSAKTDTDLGDILNGDHSTWEMVMVNGAGTQVRTVHGLLISGVSTVPMNHTWYNRTPPSP